MSIVLLGSTSGSITLSEPAVAGTTTLDLPATSGTVVVGSSAVSAAGQIPFSTNGTTYTPTAKIVSGTAVASTSGTSIDFTGIPSWVKRITVMFSEVSTNGTSVVQIQLGDSGGFETTGYLCVASNIGASSLSSTAFTSGIAVLQATQAGYALQGSVKFEKIDGNTWVANGVLSFSGATAIGLTGGRKTLSDTLTQVRITTANGTDTFDAGTINILYE
jgi:hypothetical protein